MVTCKNLMPEICTFRNAEIAYRLAKQGKRYRPEVMKFEGDRENNLLKAVTDLRELSYMPGRYFVFKIWEPKERIIMALPFYDRVVQHMIVNIVGPVFERRMIYRSYACRKDFGVHAASAFLEKRLYNLEVKEGRRIYALSGDIHHYFQSVDNEILKQIIRRYISDPDVLTILYRIIDHNGIYEDGRGIPVGNLTSQLFANVYLNELDQFIKCTLREHEYVRYMDNFIILSEDPERLRADYAAIDEFITCRLKLEFNPKSCIVSGKNGIDFVGYRHFPGFTIMRKAATRRLRQTIKEYQTGEVDAEAFGKSVVSRLGHMKHADTYYLRKSIVTECQAAAAARQNYTSIK
jgi:RNA-directed DNA polymerase